MDMSRLLASKAEPFVEALGSQLRKRAHAASEARSGYAPMDMSRFFASMAESWEDGFTRTTGCPSTTPGGISLTAREICWLRWRRQASTPSPPASAPATMAAPRSAQLWALRPATSSSSSSAWPPAGPGPPAALPGPRTPGSSTEAMEWITPLLQTTSGASTTVPPTSRPPPGLRTDSSEPCRVSRRTVARSVSLRKSPATTW
mmetsp:Transcript_76984/g.249109  ORF Transcript_76984/g.249109 Transcript_76984/m.249109 type:complete len:203 (+) Transcript_76984:98-706(+)